MLVEGTMKLSEEALDSIKDSVRKEVISELKTDGLMEYEVTEYLRSCSAEGYLLIIENTVDDVAEALSNKNPMSNTDARLLRKLRVIDYTSTF